MHSISDWKAEARKQQHSFAISLGDRVWDKYVMPDDGEELWSKIAYALAGPPRSEDRRQAFGYTKEEQERIADLKNKCIAYSQKNNASSDDAVYIAFFFVIAWQKGRNPIPLPIIRVKWGDGKNTCLSEFLDHTGRHYPSLKRFLEDNVLAGWRICVPKDGQYSFASDGQVELLFLDQTDRGEVVRALDTVSTGIGVTTSIGMVAGLAMTFFPPTSLFGSTLLIFSSCVGAPAGVYGIGRSVANIVDRAEHDQSINPFVSSEPRASWLTISASLLSLGTMTANGYLVSTAKVADMAGSGTRVFCTALNVTALSVQGLGVVNTVCELRKKKEVDSLDVLQLTTSIFFFTHSLITFKTASGIIKEAQNEVIASERSQLSPEERKVFDSMQKAKQDMYEPGKTRTMHGNNEFIRELRKIKSKQDYFTAFGLVEGNQLSVHNELTIDPKAFLQMSETERNTIVKNCEKLNKGEITIEQFNANVSAIRKEYRITFDRHRADAMNQLENKFRLKDRSIIGGRNVLENLKPHEIDRLHNVMTQAGANYNEQYMNVGHKMAELAGSSNVTEYTAAFEYGIRHMHEMAKELKHQYPNTNCKQLAADRIMNNVDVQRNMLIKFATLVGQCNEIYALNKLNLWHPRFKNAMAAANHYNKHSYFPKIDKINPITLQSYLEIATEMTQGPVTNPKWTQNGTLLCCEFISEKYGAKAIRYDILPNGTSVIATLMSHDLKPIGQPQLHSMTQ